MGSQRPSSFLVKVHPISSWPTSSERSIANNVLTPPPSPPSSLPLCTHTNHRPVLFPSNTLIEQAAHDGDLISRPHAGENSEVTHLLKNSLCRPHGGVRFCIFLPEMPNWNNTREGRAGPGGGGGGREGVGGGITSRRYTSYLGTCTDRSNPHFLSSILSRNLSILFLLLTMAS